MAKRSGKLTRAQKEAAGLLTEPSKYSVKTAHENGTDDPRLGDTWRVTEGKPYNGTTLGGRIPKPEARFNKAHLNTARQPQSSSPDKRDVNFWVKEDLLDKPMIILPGPNRRIGLNPDTKIFGKLGAKNTPKELVTLAYKGVSGFKQLSNNAHFKIPPVPKETPYNALVFFSAKEVDCVGYVDENGHFKNARYWQIDRHLSTTPHGQDPEFIVDTIYDGEVQNCAQVCAALRDFCNGASKISEDFAFDTGFSPGATLVLGDRQWISLLDNRGFFDPINRITAQSSSTKENKAVSYGAAMPIPEIERY